MRFPTLCLVLLPVLACKPGPRPPANSDATPPPSPADTSAAAPAGSIEEMEWTLVELDGKPVPASAAGKRPGFRLAADGKKVQGSAGCNRMMGSYTLDGSSLKFGPLASTKMACPAMETEQRFLKALDATTRYEVAGSTLTLYGPDGPVARLEAAPS